MLTDTSTAARRWPVYAITAFVGVFCLIVAAAWVGDHVLRGAPVEATGWVIAGATLLRLVTIAIALASVQNWGRRLPQPMVAAGLWGCAAAQLVYPVTETVVKTAVLTGLLDLPATGIGNLTAMGWFNFVAAWLIFGLPGVLFVITARDHHRRYPTPWWWRVGGLLAGAAALFGIGYVIG